MKGPSTVWSSWFLAVCFAADLWLLAYDGVAKQITGVVNNVQGVRICDTMTLTPGWNSLLVAC